MRDIDRLIELAPLTGRQVLGVHSNGGAAWVSWGKNGRWRTDSASYPLRRRAVLGEIKRIERRYMEEWQVKLQEVVNRLNAAASATGYLVKCYKPTGTGCEVRYTNLLTMIEETSKVYQNLGAALLGEIARMERVVANKKRLVTLSAGGESVTLTMAEL